MPLAGHHDVLRLQIPVNNSRSLSFRQSISHVLQVAQQLSGISLSSVNYLAQSPAIDELQRDEVSSVCLADFVDMSDVRMIQCGCGGCFLFESPHSIVSGDIRRQDFQCDFSMK